MIETTEYTIDDEIYVEGHWKLRNSLILNNGPGRITARPADGRESHDIWIPEGDGIVIFDPDNTGITLTADKPGTSVVVTKCFSRALYTMRR